jgi:chromosome partitioning protein
VTAESTGLGWPEQSDTTDQDLPHGLGWPGAGPSPEPAASPAEAGGAETAMPPVQAESREAATSGDSVAPPAADPEGEPAVPRETAVHRVRTAADIVAEAADDTTGGLADPDTPIALEAAAAVRTHGLTGPPFPAPGSTRVMVVANQKGGVGKTTTTVNLAAALALNDLRVLVVDLDPQGNASTALGIDRHADIPSVYDVLVEGRTIDEVVQPVADLPRLWCVPATIDLAGAEIELVSLVARESRLRKALTAHLQDGARYDYVLIDCPPSLGLLTVNALVGGDEVLIPIQCEYYALEGLSQLLKNIDLVRAHLNPDLAVSTILLTMYDGRTRLAAQVAEEVRAHFGNVVLRTTIPRSVRISEAPSYGQTVLTYDPGSSGALSYREAAWEMAVAGAPAATAQAAMEEVR